MLFVGGAFSFLPSRFHYSDKLEMRHERFVTNPGVKVRVSEGNNLSFFYQILVDVVNVAHIFTTL